MKKGIFIFVLISILLISCGINGNFNNEGSNTSNDDHIENKVKNSEAQDENDEIKESIEGDNDNSIGEDDNSNGNKTDIDDSKEFKLGENEREIKRIGDIVLVGKVNEFNILEGLKVYIDEEKDLSIEVSDNSVISGDLKVKDIDNDDIPDIIVYEFFGGSGNSQNIYIYKRNKDKFEKIMGPEFYISQDNFYQEYLGEGIIYFEDRNTGFGTEYDILVPYENEDWKLEDVQKQFGLGDKAWVDPYSSFEIVDENDDGFYEVKGRQIMCGVAHVDIIGEIITVYAIDKGRYKPSEVIYYKVNHKDWKRSEIGRAKLLH